MSRILPINQFKKFLEKKDAIIKTMVILARYETNREISITKHNRAYLGYNIKGNTYYFDLEYKNVLLMFYYQIGNENVELNFATEWTNDEILSTIGDTTYMPFDIGEGEFFQQTLLEDYSFLQYNLFSSFCNFIQEIEDAVQKDILELGNI